MDESADTVVSLQDVIEEDQQLELTANAVLGASDDSGCTYSKVNTAILLVSVKSMYAGFSAVGLCRQAGCVCLCNMY